MNLIDAQAGMDESGRLEWIAGPEGGSAEGPAPPGVVLLECGWEVCNPVGGIYQVLRSKARSMVARWGERYVLVGPYVESAAALEFEPRRPTGWLARVAAELEPRGIVVHSGRWLVQGRPRTVLLQHPMSRPDLDLLKFHLWQDHNLESPGGDPLVDGVLMFCDALVEFVASVCRQWRGAGDRRRGEPRVLAHFHEWLSGLAIPPIRRRQIPAATVFTTHATVLGRHLAAAGGNPQAEGIDHEAEASRLGVRAQHHYERAAAHGAHVLTTISPTTAVECESLLGRRPDAVLPNGLDVDRFSVGHEFQTLHAVFKERLHQFVTGYFFPSYPFDLDTTLYLVTSGRFEPRNKGFDLCLEACALLNRQLRRHSPDLTVVFFIITRRPTRWIRPEALHSRGVLNELREVCARMTADVEEKLFRHAAAGRRVSLDSLVEEYWLLRLRRTQAALRTDRLPHPMTHEPEGGPDEVLQHIERLGLRNTRDDRVKVVYHPDFISPTNPLWGMEYEQFLRGCHLGVFPSAYEPWGYTPQECLACGVPAITSDLAGFGGYVAQAHPDPEGWSPWILPRRGRTMEEAATTLAWRLFQFCQFDRRARIALRNEVERRSWLYDWSRMIPRYHAAHDLALSRAREEVGSA